ncbi:Lrp/AsnC family transcriptional regulator [Psychrobacter sp. PSP]|uniref:Lrp/AsnC family transcriptional regulator n=1 Tax=Psychrobacter TaxID=497 RepID=UPI000E861C72|nr:Lrp/AsnC family transcriptional regulator [Psychrobacter sp. PSP]HBL97534.1 AsnC family transcriptional regulator [Psychrobacter sp.]
MIEVDEFDLKILRAIQKDARIPQSELGEKVSLSTAAINRRLKKLKANGVIKQYTALLNQEALGFGLTIIANIEVESEKIHELDATRQDFENCPFVQQCYYVTGEWDFVLIFAVKSMDQYNDLTRELFFQNPNIKRFKTLVTMSKAKIGVGLAL